MRTTLKFCAWTLSCLLFWSSSAQAQLEAASPSPWRSPPDTSLAQDQVLLDLQQADVVYLGETHDRAADHQAQLQIIQALAQRRPQLAIGMEMFQRPYQERLDRYLAGEISEAELRQQSDYDQRWGYPWDYYLPILEFARAQQLPVLALNTPTELTRQVAQSGLESLSPDDRQLIPGDLRTDNPAYRRRLKEIYDQIHQGRSASFSFENFLLAQVLWDETMAQTIADFLIAHPGHQVIVLAGQGHIVYGDGIPDRVARRLAETRRLRQRLVLLNPLPEDQTAPAIADYFWIGGENR